MALPCILVPVSYRVKTFHCMITWFFTIDFAGFSSCSFFLPTCNYAILYYNAMYKYGHSLKTMTLTSSNMTLGHYHMHCLCAVLSVVGTKWLISWCCYSYCRIHAYPIGQSQDKIMHREVKLFTKCTPRRQHCHSWVFSQGWLVCSWNFPFKGASRKGNKLSYSSSSQTSRGYCPNCVISFMCVCILQARTAFWLRTQAVGLVLHHHASNQVFLSRSILNGKSSQPPTLLIPALSIPIWSLLTNRELMNKSIPLTLLWSMIAMPSKILIYS